MSISDLSDRSIAAKRAYLLGCTSQQLHDSWTELASCRAETSQGSLRTILERDVIAYTIIRWLSFMSTDNDEPTVFGGFLRAHYSGKSWNDIDITSSADIMNSCRKSLIFFLSFVLPIKRTKLRMSGVECKPYCNKSFTISYHTEYDEKPIKIKMDFSQRLLRSSAFFIP